jgi:hypothetical protein
MTKRTLLRCGIVIGICLILAFLYIRFGDALVGVIKGEPFYDGKRGSYWVKTLDSMDEAERRKAVQALDDFGPEWWMRAVKDEDIRVSSQAKKYLNREGPTLQPVIPVFAAVLDESDNKLRLWGAMTLWKKSGPEAKDIIPKLIDKLTDPDKIISMWAALDLAEFGPAAKPAVPALIKAVEDPSQWPDRHQVDRQYAIIALGDIGPEAQAAIPALTKAAKDPNNLVAQKAVGALKKIEAPSPQKAGS